MPAAHSNLPVILTLASSQSTLEIRRVTPANSAKHHLPMLRVICENWVDQIVIKSPTFDHSALHLSSSALSLGFVRQIILALSLVSLNCLSSILSLLNWLSFLHVHTISIYRDDRSLLSLIRHLFSLINIACTSFVCGTVFVDLLPLSHSDPWDISF